MKKPLIAAFLSAALLTGCSTDAGIKTIKDVKMDELSSLKNTSAGSNSDVTSIISSLPGGESYKEVAINGTSIGTTYGIKDGSTLTEEQFSDYWLNDDAIKRNFLYNAASIFTLIPNADKAAFTVESEMNQSFSISRDQMEKELPHSFDEYANDQEMWKKELTEFVNSEEKRTAFFEKYPISE
ncbi:DUF4825 domain-containing protein [Metabacillus sp. 84]|uniref:DUF4825 domain-containing protein n=1 Tax=unclassified Metabacillus TaxID=2675274 RepID=UPI003CF5668E